MENTVHMMSFPAEAAATWQASVADMIVHIQQEEYGIPITREQQPDLLDIAGFYQQGNGNFWLAYVGEQVVGTIALLDIGQQQVALRKMFVHQDYRGKAWGVSRTLLERAIAWAREQEVRDIYLGTTPQFKAAHRFYEKNGFVEVDQQELPASFPVMQVDKKFYRFTI